MTFIPSVVGMPRTSQKKRLTRRKRSRSAPAILKSPSKRSARKKVWTDTQMKAAIDAVKSGGSINRAALDHGVPCTTLKNRLSGRVVHGTKPGPQPYLNDKEERELALFLKDCAAVGYGKTLMDAMSIAQSVAEEKGILHGSKTKKVASKGKGAVRKGKEKAITKSMETVASSSSDTPNTSDISVLQPLKKR